MEPPREEREKQERAVWGRGKYRGNRGRCEGRHCDEPTARLTLGTRAGLELTNSLRSSD